MGMYNGYYGNSMFQGNRASGNTQIPICGITWVKGYSELNQYDVPPNNFAVFFDSEIEGRYYFKICDNIGRPTIRVFDSTEVTDKFTADGIDTSSFVTKKDLEELIRMIGGQKNGEQSIQPAEQPKQPAGVSAQSAGTARTTADITNDFPSHSAGTVK